MKFTRKNLEKIISEEIKLALVRSAGGCIGEDNEDIEDDASQQPLPANFGSGGTMGQISEDGSEGLDPYEAPPHRHGGIPERPEIRPEIDQIINDVINDIQTGPENWHRKDVIALLQQLINLSLGG